MTNDEKAKIFNTVWQDLITEQNPKPSAKQPACQTTAPLQYNSNLL